MRHQKKHSLQSTAVTRFETAYATRQEARRRAMDADVREHASALALASLGAAQEDDPPAIADAGSPSAWYYSPQEPHPVHVNALKPLKNGSTTSNKRKREEGGDGLGPQTTALTWPSLEFSESLNPLEVRLTIGDNKGNSKGSGDYQVTVASCIAQALALSQTYEEADPTTCLDSQHSLGHLVGMHTDHSESSQDPDQSQSSDWYFLASQTSSFVLEDLPDSQSTSQTSSYAFWC